MSLYEFTSLILGEGLIFLLLLASPYFWVQGEKQFAQQITLIFLITAMIIFTLKSMIPTSRPFEEFAIDVLPVTSHSFNDSFPSLHAGTAFAIAAAVWDVKNKMGGYLLLLALLVAVGRVLLFVHFPWDVIAGAAIGISVAFFMNRYVFDIKDE